MFDGEEFQQQRKARMQKIIQGYAWHIKEPRTLLGRHQSKQGVEEIREEKGDSFFFLNEVATISYGKY